MREREGFRQNAGFSDMLKTLLFPKTHTSAAEPKTEKELGMKGLTGLNGMGWGDIGFWQKAGFSAPKSHLIA